MYRIIKNNLTGEVILWMLKGICIGAFLFVLLYLGSCHMLNEYFFYTGYLYEIEIDRIEELQEYINENKLASTDSSMLREWAETRNIDDFFIFREEQLLFDVSYREDIYPGGVYIELNNKSFWIYHIVSFSDGEASVYIYEGDIDKYYHASFAISLILGILVCFLVIVADIKKLIEYICCLKQEVQLISEGDLKKEITIQGKDELTELAAGLNQMRLELIRKEENEKEMRLAQEQLVLGMSHDLRTPLTSLFIYMEILRKQYPLGEINGEYLEKAYDKILQIRTLSDQIFEYFLVSGKEKVELEEPDDIQNTLGEYLSELCFVMEADDFHVEMPEIQWKSAFIQINTDYMGRIMNNLISNMKKYADKNQKIYMELFEEKDWVGMRVQNGIIQTNPCVKGSGIGLKNIEIMMKKMNGYMSVDMTESFFTIVLYFPRCASEEINRTTFIF